MHSRIDLRRCLHCGNRHAASVCPACKAPEPLSHFFTSHFHPTDREKILSAALYAAMAGAGTDFGNIQLIERERLFIQAQHGFSYPFLDFFKLVIAQPESACGAALATRAQVFVDDVETHAIFANTRAGEVMIRAGSRAVLSTPIVDDSGAVLGMISSHFRARTHADGVDFSTQRNIAARLGRLLRRP